MTAMLYRGEAQAFLVWEPELKKTFAFIGVQYVARGQDRIGQMIWLMGENRAHGCICSASSKRTCVSIRAAWRSRRSPGRAGQSI
jgi:hypothetical protein